MRECGLWHHDLKCVGAETDNCTLLPVLRTNLLKLIERPYETAMFYTAIMTQNQELHFAIQILVAGCFRASRHQVIQRGWRTPFMFDTDLLHPH